MGSAEKHDSRRSFDHSVAVFDGKYFFALAILLLLFIIAKRLIPRVHSRTCRAGVLHVERREQNNRRTFRAGTRRFNSCGPSRHRRLFGEKMSSVRHGFGLQTVGTVKTKIPFGTLRVG